MTDEILGLLALIVCCSTFLGFMALATRAATRKRKDESMYDGDLHR